MLELISIKKKYTTKAGDTQALDDVSLRFPETGLVFITGKSGSGKTTLLNVIGGLDGFDSGEIRLNGKSFSNFNASDFDSYRNTFVGFVFQEYNLLNEYTVGKNVDIALELQGAQANKEQVDELFNSVEIAGLDGRKPNQLSGGQKQRVAIVRALIKNPKIILADELTGALDSVTGEQVMDILKKLSKEKLVIVVSHDLEIAEKYADRIIKIADGKVVDDITLNDVELQGNLYEANENITVKKPSDLTEKEGEILLTAIKENKKITFTDKIAVRERAKTIEPERIPDQDIRLINSKMKLGSAISLGAKSLWTKPIRLIITILLSVVAFAVFGLFDAIASYDDAKVITGLLKDGTYKSLPIYATYNDDYYDNTQLKLSKAQIDELNEDTGYKFRGVYDLQDTDIVRANSNREGMNSSVDIGGLPAASAAKPIGWAYYSRMLNGMITFDQTEIQTQKVNGRNVSVIDPKGFNYSIICGEYPVFPAPLQEVEGNHQEELQVAISSYAVDCIRFWMKSNESYEDFIGKDLTLGKNTYKITAVVDCGGIPEKYSPLKSREEQSLQDDFETYLCSGCHLNVFAPTGLVEHLRAKNNRAVNYYADYKNTAQTVTISGTGTNFSGRYYNFADISNENYIFFDNAKTELKNGETLISLSDLRNEYVLAELENANKIDLEELRTLVFRLSSATNKEMINELLVELCTCVQKVQVNSAGLEKELCKTIRIENKSIIGDKLLHEGTLKVVGIYFGLDTDTQHLFYSKIEPLVVTEQSLTSLQIATEQGVYSRAITPLSTNRSGASIMGDKMNRANGLNFNWFGNSVLETVAAERDMLDQVLNLILYIAIALALFSVFMLFNYISLSIASKRQTIGILRTLGANKKNIFIMFITEALIISIINGIFACILGYFGCAFVNTYIMETMNLTLNIAMFDIRQILMISLGSIITGVLSSLAPIFRIAKKKPVELIRTL